MVKWVNKIWAYLINRRVRMFAKSPVFTVNNFESINRKYFRYKSSSKVISIGNISFGGTGKTPLIVTLVNDFLPRDARIGIVAKGYKRQEIKDLIITNDNYTKFTIDQIGDEPSMLFKRLRLPISISEQKFVALNKLEKQFSPEIVIIDDGYQHLWIERDLNILLLDNKILSKLNQKSFMLMREPISSINRADVVMIPRNQHFDYSQFDSKSQPIVHFHFELDRISSEFINKEKSQNYIAFAGIANPDRFFNTLYEHNIDPIKKIIFRDHYNYTQKDMVKLIKLTKRKKADLITTEKDLTKIIKFKHLFEEFRVNLDCVYIKIEVIERNLFESIIKEKINV